MESKHEWGAWEQHTSHGLFYDRVCTRCGIREWFDPEAKGMDWHGEDHSEANGACEVVDRDGTGVRDLRDGV